MRFRRLIAAPSIWKHINVLKEHSKQVYKRWIDSNGLHRLLTKAVPKGVVASLTVGNIPKNILFQIVEAHPSIQELNLIGSNYDQHNKLSGMRKLERLKILRVLTSDHGGRRMPSCVHEIIRTSNNLEELALNCSVFEAPANQPNWIHPSEDLPTVLANKDPRLPVHATLRRLTLESSVSMKVFMSLLQTWVSLRATRGGAFLLEHVGPADSRRECCCRFAKLPGRRPAGRPSTGARAEGWQEGLVRVARDPRCAPDSSGVQRALPRSHRPVARRRPARARSRLPRQRRGNFSPRQLPGPPEA
ncbi:hypothetical protein DFJ74DRAFT_652990 [Hyaloraphidium curvatum]|nr:hypothetical protein DFJ74DRAFT_652990 [Hyaloraphidium curvatum]